MALARLKKTHPCHLQGSVEKVPQGKFRKGREEFGVEEDVNRGEQRKLKKQRRAGGGEGGENRREGKRGVR